MCIRDRPSPLSSSVLGGSGLLSRVCSPIMPGQLKPRRLRRLALARGLCASGFAHQSPAWWPAPFGRTKGGLAFTLVS
eukprot:6407085-Alexandrium_andersonii.AAC.1